jgi:hypothetical protein
MAKIFQILFDNNKRLIWYGLAFRQAKMIGTIGFNDPYKIVNYYFTNWNELINREYKKYDIRMTWNIIWTLYVV